MRFNWRLSCWISQFFTTGNIGQKEAQGRMQGLPPLPCPLRFRDVKGFEGRTNDVIYCLPETESATSTVVYFPGDVQDYSETMEAHRDNKKYVQWSLDNIALLLKSYHPESHIVIVKPTRMEFKTFACYNNFVPSNNCGVPDHTPNHNALLHLERLLQSLTQLIMDLARRKLSRHPTLVDSKDIIFPALDKTDIQLMGFSKGCVVLNQFIYEFHYCKTLTPEDDSMCQLIPRIRHMYWLDGGHAGGKNTWITSRSLLETLTRLGIEIHIHVTPYQINDDRRPWIRKEEKLFSDLLRRLGAPVKRFVHFETEIPSLETHFGVITAYKLAERRHSLMAVKDM
uniref:Uncharacterized protein n=1 Tax=Cuerna arida TaxID=1464854 RepID=A0A1B6GQ05_9HEMI